jgi:hypothetical protein
MELLATVKTVTRLDAEHVQIVWRRRSGFLDFGRAIDRATYDGLRSKHTELRLPPWEQITSVQPLDAA